LTAGAHEPSRLPACHFLLVAYSNISMVHELNSILFHTNNEQQRAKISSKILPFL